MHRMRCLFVRASLFFALMVGLAVDVAAELIQSPGGRAYPDLAGAISGTQHYDYNPLTQTGTLQVINTPFLLTTGPSVANEMAVQPNVDGMRTQVLNLKLDPNGRLLSDPGNSYSLYGTVVLNGRTFQGLLLQATPTAFGAQSGASASFNLDLKVTGGELARTFGPSVYMEFHAGGESTFDGNFARSFTTKIDSSNTLGYKSSAPTLVPEPTTLVVILVGGVWLAVSRRRRRVLTSRGAKIASAESSDD